MNTSSNAVPESAVNSGVTDPGYNNSLTRPWYWSVWRELWENRSIYIAPLIVAAFEVFGFAISTIGLADRRRAVLLLDAAHQRAAIEQPYDLAAMMMVFIVFIVGVFYCLDALHGERRDRSILFWKSLPVSDLTTVLSKVTIPVVVLPLIVFAIVVCVQVIMLLLVSGWARRATFLWAVLPIIAIQIFEKITFNTSYFGSLVKYRLMGFAPGAFEFHGRDHPTIDSLAQLTPGRYLSSPGLWIGLVFAAAFLAAAVRLRRYRGPL